MRCLGDLLALGTLASTLDLQDGLQGPAQDMADGLATAYPFAVSWPDKFADLIQQYPNTTLHKSEGRPFALKTIHSLATAAGDLDAQCALDCERGLHLATYGPAKWNSQE
jgi:hypothetical protein